jgi:hypothetical protein
MFLQPFLAYQATRTVTLTVQSESTANWQASDQQWTVPINVVIGKLSSFGTFPASSQFGAAARSWFIPTSGRRGKFVARS